MEVQAAPAVSHEDPDVLRSLLQVGVNLGAIDDLPQMLNLILSEVRKLARAEAGALYILRKDGRLRLTVAQNDRVAARRLQELLQDKEMPVTSDSVVGFAASTGTAVNIPNSYVLPPGSPFRINRDFEAATGYRTRSILALPLRCPNGKCIGVLEMFNRIGEDAKVTAFEEGGSGPITSLAGMAAITIHNALLQEDLKRAHLDTIIRLSVAAEYRDDNTGAHIRRISQTSALIAKGMGLPGKQVEVIRFASPMHDVGKIAIPDSILLKPGRLSPEERRVVEEHPMVAAEILGDPLNDLVDAARAVALTHHERWDGKGYPSRLAGEQIPMVGRIVALADVFDALVSKRTYKEAYSVEKALDIIRQEDGKHFDPQVVKGFFAMLGDILEFYRDPAVREDTIMGN